jgi:hypothetical protein
MSLEKLLFYIFLIATIVTVLMAVSHLCGIRRFKTYDHWIAPMTLAITLTLWEKIDSR